MSDINPPVMPIQEGAASAPEHMETPDAADAALDMQELIDSTPDLAQCPQHWAIMICGATGDWDRLRAVYPDLAKDPLKAFAELNDTEYMLMKEYFTHRLIDVSVNEADDFWS